MITRFAPALTGFLHLGHVVNALHVWGIAGQRHGRVLLRIEDPTATRVFGISAPPAGQLRMS
ncbi:MAG: glutamate--tRNA ligase family protein [Vicinamibacterales bacterium]